MNEPTPVIAPAAERRAGRRVKVSRPTLIVPSDTDFKEEILTTVNSSRDGLYFVTHAQHYCVGMRVRVTFGYVPNDPCSSASFGEVVRVEELKDGTFGVAVQILLR